MCFVLHEHLFDHRCACRCVFRRKTDEKHTVEEVVNQFVFSIMLIISREVDMRVNIATKVIHDATMKQFFDFEIPFADVNNDIDIDEHPHLHTTQYFDYKGSFHCTKSQRKNRLL